MSNKFGALTDHFGLATTDLVLIDSNAAPIAETVADARDENNDVTAAAIHGNDEFSREEISCTYALKSGTMIDDLKVGELTASTIFAETMTLNTSNTDWPTLEVSGFKGLNEITAPSATLLNTFALPDLTAIKGIKQAQVIGFTVGDNCKLTSSSLTATCEHAQQDNGVGEPVADGVSGASCECTAEFVGITAAPSWAVTESDATETQKPGAAEGQAAWHTGTGVWYKILSRETVD